MKPILFFVFAILIIILDHTVKLAVHFNMELGPIGEIALIGDWFKLHYTLNPGMAFGMSLGEDLGKLALTFFRIIAVFGLSYFLVNMCKKGAHKGFLISLSMILAGAAGNVLDSIFYGVFLENNAPILSGEGSSMYPWFYGQVIDMFYIDIWEGYIGGKFFSFWPIFNVADASIFLAVVNILINQKKYFPQQALPA